MQEYGWFHWNDLRDMVCVIGEKRDIRKMRLAACAWVRTVWDDLENPHLRTAVEVAEQFADFQAKKQQMKAVRGIIDKEIERARRRELHARSQASDSAAEQAKAHLWLVTQFAQLVTPLLETRQFDSKLLSDVSFNIDRLFGKWGNYKQQSTLESDRCSLLRDIFGNPFRQVVLNPSWLTSTVIALAKQIYDSKDFSVMPILADALQDASCENEEILNHCRGPGPHTRGCFAIDLILGKQ